MINISRVSLAYFIAWAFAVVSLTALASGQKSQVAMTDELVHEIESLDVIQQVNVGQFNSDQVALIEDSAEASSPLPNNVKSHRSPRRAVLSQR